MDTTAPVARPRTRRSPEEQIAALQARVDAIKEREALRLARSSPDVRRANAVIRAIDAALHESQDLAVGMALTDARQTLVGCLAGKGVRMPSVANGAVGQRVVGTRGATAEELREYVLEHPGRGIGQIAAAFRVSSWTMRRMLKPLIDSAKVRREGASSRTAYYPA